MAGEPAMFVQACDEEFPIFNKVTRNRGSFPSEEAAFKLLYLAMRNASKKWSTLQFWREAMRQFEMIYPGRREAAKAAG